MEVGGGVLFHGVRASRLRRPRPRQGGRQPGAGGMNGCRAGIMGDGDLGVGSRWVRVCASVLAERYSCCSLK